MSRSRYRIYETNYPYFVTQTVVAWLPVFSHSFAVEIIVDSWRHLQVEDPQQIQNDEMLWQKLEYLHLNPLLRGYVDRPKDWRYSSARNYAGRAGLIDVVTNWR